ncbi:GMC family oxidoreductase [Microvirga makkahensis]|uniref:Choline dehydrogenase n=1 Tax=Microvirga makkahensis TaxID=1128670 RepID=A0A7X3SMQ1_9HYPH|nr:choline dehydrogenase [Microvirga makkahensis]MXQ10592.1 choline dehydrogenase [Microvirga makkahensis]
MESFDYIIVGGGTAGCVLANRLTANSKNSVLMLEAGGTDSGFWISIPAGFSKLLTNAKYNWRFQTEPEENVYNRTIVVPRGKGLGGSTLINGMIFVRGQAQDYDLWAQMGATGWSFQDVLPYFKRLEAFEDGESELRGGSGPLHIVRVAERPPISEAFIEAAKQAGFPRNPDYNGASQEGFGYYQVNQHKGRRWSAADAYLRPALSRPNLKVQTLAHVTRINFEGRRAVGVRYRIGNEEREVRARAEVILAAGAVQTPHLLELSGVGDPGTLASAGIPVFHALPGVGNNYIDHFATRMNWRVKLPVTLNELTRGWRLGLAVGQYFLTRKGILTYGTGLAHGFVKTRPELETPDVQYFFMHASYANAGERKLDREPGMTIGVTQLRPESRGSIHIKSPDPMAPPAIRPNFLSARTDQESLIGGMRIARRIIEQPAMDRYRAYEMNPGSNVNTDDEWLDFARRNGQTIYHAIGTCSMGKSPRAVVDERLRVHGLEGLRIVDASVMPAMVSANTAAAVMMIAEKGSDLVQADAREKVS